MSTPVSMSTFYRPPYSKPRATFAQSVPNIEQCPCRLPPLCSIFFSSRIV